jgi:hypothetical protein
VVDAGPDVFLTLPGDSLELQGSAADDGLPEPAALTTEWTVIEGPAAVAFADPASVATSATFPEAGAYVLRLTASDGALTTSDEVRVTVLAENAAPSVEAGPDRTLELPATTLTLTGSVSDDGNPVGSELSVGWVVVSGPAPVVFGTPGAAVTTATFSTPGSYALRLTASDGDLESSDDVVVTVIRQNLPPQVDAGPDRTLLLPESSLTWRAVPATTVSRSPPA